MAQNGQENDAGAKQIMPPQKICCREQSGPNRIQQQAVAQRDVCGIEILSRAHSRLKLHLFEANEHKNAPGKVGQHGRQNECAETDPRFQALCNKAYRIVTYEHSVLRDALLTRAACK
jgi:hypothetical protein